MAGLSNCSAADKLPTIYTMFKRYRENIREALKARGWSRADLARTTRIDFSYLDRLLQGKARFNEDLIEAIAKALGVAPSGAPAPIPVRITYSRTFEDPRLPQKREFDYLPIPIVEPRVAAGNPEVVSSEQVLDIVFIHRRALKRRSAQGYICTVVTGDSMAPVIRDGAIVCIDSRARPEGRKVPKESIWAVRKGEGTVIKHLQFKDDLILLISENPAYEIETTSDPMAIIGRVVGVWQNLA
ncbi:MAG: XRE family transcriptional regulator [Deltaproteobacteria bacterium]|nr:XRE family transcriptional regulator [Deltaproteobacteria bacterium]